MRIRFMAKGLKNAELPVLMESYGMTGYVKDGKFVIEFGINDDLIRFKRETNTEEEIEKASQTFRSIQTSLALNGYANLVAGEQTSLIDEDWEYSEVEENV